MPIDPQALSQWPGLRPYWRGSFRWYVRLCGSRTGPSHERCNAKALITAVLRHRSQGKVICPTSLWWTRLWHKRNTNLSCVSVYISARKQQPTCKAPEMWTGTNLSRRRASAPVRCQSTDSAIHSLHLAPPGKPKVWCGDNGGPPVALKYSIEAGLTRQPRMMFLWTASEGGLA